MQKTVTQIATNIDVLQLVQLVNSAYRGESSRRGWTTEADLLDGTRITEKAMQSTICDENTTILKLLSNNNELLGCVLLIKNAEIMYLGMLTVQPTLQNAGLGKILMTDAEHFAKQRGCIKMEMTVISDRTELIEWYQRRGYRLTGEQRPFPMNDPNFGIPKKNLHFEVMEKDISNDPL